MKEYKWKETSRKIKLFESEENKWFIYLYAVSLTQTI